MCLGIKQQLGAPAPPPAINYFMHEAFDTKIKNCRELALEVTLITSKGSNLARLLA
jgi:hypothetical protein